MSSKKSHIDKELFRRYLSDEMTDTERNAFEKELQKNPFEAEAMDGFESVSSSNLENDLNELTQKISSKKRKNSIPYFAAAATILLLITSGIIVLQLNHQNPTPKVSEIEVEKIEKQTAEPEKKEPAKDLSEDIVEPEASGEKQAELATEETPEQKLTETNEDKIETREELTIDAADNEIVINDLAENEIIMGTIPVALLEQSQDEVIQRKVVTTNQGIELAKTKPTQVSTLKTATSKENIIRGQIISDSDGQPLPGVAVIEKGTANGTITDINGNFQMELKNDSNPVVASFIGMESTEFNPEKDSDNIVALITNNESLDEVVVVGYGTQKKESVTGATTVFSDETLNLNAQPICGISDYKTYLKNEAVLPTDFETDKVVVKLRFSVSSTGKINSFENMNDADTKFYESAKNIVLNGPAWTPAYMNNREVDSKVKLRVVFKKSDD